MPSAPLPSVRARQIGQSDINGVADLLARGFRSRTRQFWLRVLARLTDRPPPAGLPKYGYLLESSGTLVGVILLIFSTARTGISYTTRCNVSSWYVEPAFRTYAGLLASQALKHKEVTYLDVTPAPHTRAIVEAQGYSRYSGGVFIAAPALNFCYENTQVREVGANADLDVHLDSFERDLLMEHVEYGCMSLWCVTSERAYPFVFRPRLARGVIPYAQLIYCRDLEDLVRFAGPIGRFLAMRRRPLVFIDSNGPIPGLVGRYIDGRMPKYFKGPDRPRLGDLANTEIAMFGM
jgi:hypothetical protein